MCKRYKTISKPSDGVYKEKGSRFLAFAYPVLSIEEIKELYHNLKKEHHAARHHCYAYRLGADGGVYKAYDDNEPSYTAGKPILGQITSFGLTNVMIVVVRYFGGTLLGKGGLIVAYRQAASDALQKADIIEKIVEAHYRFVCGYTELNKLMGILKDNHATINRQVFDDRCEILAGITIDKGPKIVEQLSVIDNIEIEPLKSL